jgi:outer membrane protein OmpA-like peptidoglycan-associated protein
MEVSMLTKTLVATATALFLFAGPALAGDATYTADDIVKFFASQKPVTRGICVGTDEECGKKDEPGMTAAFDLLINFPKNSAKLTDDAQNKLLQVSVALNHPKLSDKRFAVDGFTDASGGAAHNLRLSERRAQSVVQFLTSLGVDGKRLEAHGYGETHLRVQDAFDPINRRVETRIVDR